MDQAMKGRSSGKIELEPAPETIGQAEMHAMQIAVVQLEAAKARREAATAHEESAALRREFVHREIVRTYGLGPRDQYDWMTGAITRAPVAELVTPRSTAGEEGGAVCDAAEAGA